MVDHRGGRGGNIRSRFAIPQWTSTGVHSGFGCACVLATVSRGTASLGDIKSVQPQSTQTCRSDRSIGAPR
ncbi:DUF4087 domain-containing protein [Lysobacter arvi]|uniref:DUF4087 domain-containing protein n=1 Tax=Lysobacter arvi TaxID=3038776 RepID=UPI003CCE03F2